MNMKKKFLNKKGFTLIEIIASLVILGILGSLGILGAVRVIEGFLFIRINAETAQKGQIAMNRLTKEFTNIMSVNTGTTTATSINFTSRSYLDGTIQTGRSVSLVSTTLVLDGNVLTDDVSGFSMAYLDTFDGAESSTWSGSRRIIRITLSLVGANNTVSTFTSRVASRNL